MNYELDHIGIAVADLDAAISDYEKSFGLCVELREEVPSQGVKLAFLKMPHVQIELLAPTSDSSGLKKFLDSRGPGLHHICYRVTDIRQELAALEAKGLKLIDKTPRHGAKNTEIAFIHPKSCGGVLTELCEYRK